jgi:hypothetical protein
MFQYPSNGLLIFNETDNAHFPLASGACKGIYLINLLNQSSPIPPIFLFILKRTVLMPSIGKLDKKIMGKQETKYSKIK